jgi:hypothetical protein
MRNRLKVLPADQLDVLHLQISEYERSVRGDDEIELNGKMYDIARVEMKNNKVIVYCLHDSAEDNLLSLLDQVLKSAAKDSQQASSSLFQFNFLSFILPSAFSVTDLSTSILCPFTSYLIGDSSFVTSLDTPPPQA